MALPLGDARPVQSYHITLWNMARTMTAVSRIVVRESDAEAIDSARRWLRLVRRSNAGHPRLPDRWTVSVKGKTSLPTIIASGSVDD